VKRTYTLGDFVDIWGQALAGREVGSAHRPVTAFFNRRLFTGNPRRIPLLAHAEIRLDVGKPLVAPERITFPRACERMARVAFLIALALALLLLAAGGWTVTVLRAFRRGLLTKRRLSVASYEAIVIGAARQGRRARIDWQLREPKHGFTGSVPSRCEPLPVSSAGTQGRPPSAPREPSRRGRPG
jgi:hypothetical protein